MGAVNPGSIIQAGSSGFLELAANQASAAKLTRCGAGAKVWLTRL